MLFKKKTNRVRRQNTEMINRYKSENLQVKKVKPKTTVKRKKRELNNEISCRAIRWQSVETISDLVANGDYVEAYKVNNEEHDRTKKNVKQFSEVIVDAAVDTEDEFFSCDNCFCKQVECKIHDHTKTINYHLDEVKHDLFNEEVLF